MPKLRLGLLSIALLLPLSVAHAQGDPRLGAKNFQPCAACHSLEPRRHMTGPSLAGIVGRKAATIAAFSRYSPALKKAGIAWDEQTLDRWLADPQEVVPGTYMVVPGVRDPRARIDLIAFLKSASDGKPAPSAQAGDMPGSGMMMSGQGRELPDLKTLGSDAQLASIRYCRDTYFVSAVSGKAMPMWENNLRFKTDSSDKGPRKGHPVLVPSGMMGDRAYAVFADPAEISAFIESRC